MAADDDPSCYLCISPMAHLWASAKYVSDVPLCEMCRLRHSGSTAWPIPVRGD